MGTIDWTAVALAWLFAAAVGVAGYGRRALPRAPVWQHALAALLMAGSALMIGHMFARVGQPTLAAKPWLYFMMTGGLALAFIGPAMVATAVRRSSSLRDALYDWAMWIAAYLAIGLAFYLAG